MNDFLIEHQDQVQKILEQLCEASLQLNIDKCKFEIKKTKYLEFIIFAKKDIQMNPAKVSAIKQWESSKSVTAIQSFLCLSQF